MPRFGTERIMLFVTLCLMHVFETPRFDLPTRECLINNFNHFLTFSTPTVFHANLNIAN
jgi:hypothetical protein